MTAYKPKRKRFCYFCQSRIYRLKKNKACCPSCFDLLSRELVRIRKQYHHFSMIERAKISDKDINLSFDMRKLSTPVYLS